MNKKTRKAVVIFLVMVFTIISLSAIITVPISFKVIRTDLKLFLVSLDVQLLENDARNSKPGYGWPENSVKYYKYLMKQRNDLCTSDDVVVRTVANSNNLIRLLHVVLIIFVAVIQITAFTYDVYLCYLCAQRHYKKRHSKKRHSKKR